MSDNNDNKQKSFFDLSRYSDKTRKIIFGVTIAVLLAIVLVAMFIISPGAAKNKDPKPTSTGTSTQAPVNPDATETPTVTPSTNPTSPEDEEARAQQKIIDDAAKNNTPEEDIHDYETEVPNSDGLLNIAKSGVMAYCVIEPGETTDQRRNKMQPYFHADNSKYRNPAEAYYQRTCSIEATSGPTVDDKGAIHVVVAVAWSAVLSADATTAQAGYTQYTAIVDDSGIISLYD